MKFLCLLGLHRHSWWDSVVIYGATGPFYKRRRCIRCGKEWRQLIDDRHNPIGEIEEYKP